MCVSVCLSVTTITRGKGKTKFVFRYDRYTDVEVTLAIVYKIASSGNSKLAGRKIVRVASVAKCWRQKRFCGDLYSLRILSI